MAKTRQNKEDGGINIDREIKKNIHLIIIVVVLIAIFILLYYLFQGLGKINYQELSFTKEKLGELVVYTHNYFVKNSEGRVIENTLYVRNNPLKNNVSVEGKIIYPLGERMVLIGINSTGLETCEDSRIAIATIGIFINTINLRTIGGTLDENESIKNNSTYISCIKYQNNPVILIRASNESKIVKSGEFCYNLDVANCEIQKVAEKFVIHSILDAKE